MTLRWLCFVAVALGTQVVVAEPQASTPPRSFVTEHTAVIGGRPVRYTADFEEFVVEDGTGAPALSLFATTYLRDDTKERGRRPVVFIFNGGPSGAASGLHMELGPRERMTGGSESPKDKESVAFADNPDSLLDVADLVMFDPAESGYSRVLPGSQRDYFYSTSGDAYSLAQLVQQWAKRHDRQSSPRYLLGESYGSVRAVVTADLLNKRGVALDGVILLGDSIFLQETSRRTHNIVSTAVSLPMLALTAAYHGKADKHGKSDADFLDEVYGFAINDYLPALAKGFELPEAERQRIAERLAAYTGIPAEYFLKHGLTIAKQDFNRELLPGMVLNANDTRRTHPAPPPGAETHVLSIANPAVNPYAIYLHDELKVELPGLEYEYFAPDSFETWDWGTGCNAYLIASDLCSLKYAKPSVFEDYDWPEVLKRQFAQSRFRTMIVAGYYDGLSSIGTHRYLRAQLGFPRERFELHEYAAGHATAADATARPLVNHDIKVFLSQTVGAPASK